MPFSLVLDPKDVDPNVHPTKREVHFLNEEEITELISDHVQKAVAQQSSSRTFETQVSPLVAHNQTMLITFKDLVNRWNIG